MVIGVITFSTLCYNSAQSGYFRTYPNNKSSNNVSDHSAPCSCFCDRAKSIIRPDKLSSTRDPIMICPGTSIECDNPGCRRGGCQGRMPELPLFQATRAARPQAVAQPALLIPDA